MDSLYGGKPGSPFVIKQAFPTIEAMVAEFAKGAGSNKVWYGEYCIIDTVNKNDKTNGCIYRRGYTGPEYIGQIVGPKGGQGNFAVKSIEDVAEYLQSDLFKDESNVNYRNYPTYKDNKLGWNWVDNGEGESLLVDKGYRDNGKAEYFDAQSYRDSNLKSDVAIQEFNIQDKSLVPGKDENGNYNDSIRWNYCNVRLSVDKDGNVPSELDTWMYIGFEFPYSVFEMSATKVEHYKPANIEELDESKPHPYYWKYNIDVPAGRPGQDLVSIYVEDYDPTNEVHQQAMQGVTKVPVEGKPIWLYQVKNYENQSEDAPEPTINTLFASEYRGEYVIKYDIENSYTTDKTTLSEYLEWLNGGGISGTQNQVITCVIGNEIFAFVYDNGTWKYTGTITSSISSQTVETKTYQDIFFTRQ